MHHIIGPNSDLGPGWVEFSFQHSSHSEGPGQEVRYNTNTACPSDGMGHHAQLCKRNQKGWNVVFVFSRKVVLRKNKPVMHYAMYLVFSLCLPNHHNHNLARVLVTWKCSVNANKQRNAMQSTKNR